MPQGTNLGCNEGAPASPSGSRPSDQAQLHGPDAPRFDPSRSETSLRGKFRFLLGARGKPTAFAKERGLCDETVLSFLRGTRPPEPKLLEAIGYRRECRYVPCPCFRCTKARTDIDPGAMQFGVSVEMMRMFLCETCGNKRCPHAAYHRNVCTNSNAPRQKGSLYEDAPASGIETEGQDGATRLGAEHESPTAEGGDAQLSPSEPPNKGVSDRD